MKKVIPKSDQYGEENSDQLRDLKATLEEEIEREVVDEIEEQPGQVSKEAYFALDREILKADAIDEYKDLA